MQAGVPLGQICTGMLWNLKGARRFDRLFRGFG